jgi:membrane fusion protein, multidrug efflux system
MFADARIVSGEAKHPVVPKSALVQKEGRDTVSAVVDRRLEERVVQLGATKGDLVACVRGIKAGERIVNRPAPTLHNGQAVE